MWHHEFLETKNYNNKELSQNIEKNLNLPDNFLRPSLIELPFTEQNRSPDSFIRQSDHKNPFEIILKYSNDFS